MIIDDKDRLEQLNAHAMAGRIFQIGNAVVKYDYMGDPVIVASCTSEEAAKAAFRLMGL